MALLELFARSATPQVVFVGPYGVGKSTAVRAVSDVEVVPDPTVVPAAPGTRAAQRAAANGSERGEWAGGPDGPLTVLSVAGQLRFRAVGPTGLVPPTRMVLWLYGHTPDALEEAEEWLAYISPELHESPLTVAVTRLEVPGDRPALVDYRPLVDRWVRGAPIVSADPRDRESVEEVLVAAVRAPAPARAARAVGA
jgi:signal recognition particle receptor subunit beta